MSKFLLKSLLVSPAAVGAMLAVSSIAIAAEVPAQKNAEGAIAQAPEVLVAQAVPAASETDSTLDQINRYSREGRSQQSQVTSVSQFTDVRPTDWAFQALQSLVERYGCVVGYPDKTYRGNRAMTRYEFAAGLNACMDRVNELIAAATADLVRKEDLLVLQRLQEEFAAELATLRGRVDALEVRTATLEKQQFSTTTKLSGEVVFAVTTASDRGQFNGVGTTETSNETVFQDRVRLTLNTSFTGKDLLVTRLAAGNATTFNTPGSYVENPNGTLRYFSSEVAGAEGIQTFNFGNTGGNSVVVDWIAYYFPIGEKIKVYVPAVSGLHYDYAPTLSPALDAFDGGTGPLSIFAQRNPIYLIGGGSGVGVNYQFTDTFSFSAGYLADNSNVTRGAGGSVTSSPLTFGANNPNEKNGLFNGSYSALAQVAYTGETFGFGVTYVNAYRRGAIFDTGSGLPSSGSFLANTKVRGNAATPTDQFPATVNAYGASGYYKITPGIVFNAFLSYVNADFVTDGVGSADIWTYGAGLAFPDLGKRGNLAGIIAGVEPYMGNPREVYPGTGTGGVRNNVPIHVEGFYKWQINDNISITPGVIWIVNPGQDSRNDSSVIGTVRTTFTF